MKTISHLSTEYVKVPVTSPLAPVVLAELDVEMAVLPEGQDPSGGDWESAQWNDAGTHALVLVGPATTLPLTKGVNYAVWVRVTSSPEIPVLAPGSVHVT